MSEAYAELQVTSHFSFLRGASSCKELFAQAAGLGIAALALFQFGAGPVKGFAVTLTIGLVTSVFTAIYLTRLMIVFWLEWRKPKELIL